MSRPAPVQPPTPKYVHCKCPHCKLPLDYLETTEEECPRCHNVLEPEAVWNTRSYEGTFILPPWILAFTWPLALMLIGGFFASQGFLTFGGLLAAIGLTFFIAKLALNSRDV